MEIILLILGLILWEFKTIDILIAFWRIIFAVLFWILIKRKSIAAGIVGTILVCYYAAVGSLNENYIVDFWAFCLLVETVSYTKYIKNIKSNKKEK